MPDLFEIHSVEELEKLSSEVKWQYFEKLVAFIFEKNDFDVMQNKVLVGKTKKRQFDVIAKSKELTFLIECKKWKSRANSASELRKAVETHLERCSFYKRKNKKEKIMPLLVTLLDGMPESHEDVFIVPIRSLNWFLQSSNF